ncbi:hypothetical protein H0H81_000293, partial [Sphagnurus paluster]
RSVDDRPEVHLVGTGIADLLLSHRRAALQAAECTQILVYEGKGAGKESFDKLEEQLNGYLQNRYMEREM